MLPLSVVHFVSASKSRDRLETKPRLNTIYLFIFIHFFIAFCILVWYSKWCEWRHAEDEWTRKKQNNNDWRNSNEMDIDNCMENGES